MMSSRLDYNFPPLGDCNYPSLLNQASPVITRPQASFSDLLHDATSSNSNIQHPDDDIYRNMDNNMLYQFPPGFDFEDATGLAFDENLNPYDPSVGPFISDTVDMAGALAHTQDAASFNLGEAVGPINNGAPEHILQSHARESPAPRTIPAATSTNHILSPARESPILRAVPTATPINQEHEDPAVADDDGNNTTHASRNPAKPVIDLRKRNLDAETKARYKSNGKKNKEQGAELARDIVMEAALRARNAKALADKHFKTVHYINELLNTPKMVKAKENEVSVANVLFSQFSKEVNGCE